MVAISRVQSPKIIIFIYMDQWVYFLTAFRVCVCVCVCKAVLGFVLFAATEVTTCSLL